MNLLALLATIYVAGAIATHLFLIRQAPGLDVPGMASRRVVVFRSAVVSLLWPVTLVVGCLLDLSPSLREWIETGRIGDDR